MSNIIRSSIIIILMITNIANSHANDLKELLAKAYTNSNVLAKNQLQFKSSIEQYTFASSAFLPDIIYNINTQENSQNSSSETSSYLQARLSLFNGGGSTAALKSARAAVDAAKAELYHQEQEYLLNSINTYVDYHFNLKIYDVSNSSVKATKSQYEAAKEKLKLHEATKTDVANAQAKYSRALAERSKIYSKLVETKLKFNNLFGNSAYTKSNISIPKIDFKNVKELEKAVINNNYQYIKAQSNIIAQKYKIWLSSSKLSPQIQGSVLYHDVSASKTHPAGSYTTSMDINIPIFKGSDNAYSTTRKDRNDWKSFKLALIEMNKNLKEQANTLWAVYDACSLRVKYSKEAIVAAELVYNGTKQEQEVGNKSMLDVLNAESDLYQTRKQYLDAKQEHISIAYQIRLLAGDLTAKSLGLKVKLFDPEIEFQRISRKLIGF